MVGVGVGWSKRAKSNESNKRLFRRCGLYLVDLECRDCISDVITLPLLLLLDQNQFRASQLGDAAMITSQVHQRLQDHS